MLGGGHDQSALVTMSVHDDGQRLVVALTGEIDLSNAEQVLRDLDQAFTGRSETGVDLSGLAFLDSAGIAALGRLDRDARLRGVSMAVIAAPGSVAARTLHLSGMDRVFTMSAAPESA